MLGDNVEIGDGVVVRGEGRILIGHNVRIYDNVYFLCKKNAEIVIADDVTIGTSAYFESGGQIIIGERTGVWQNCLITANCGSKVVIGDDCKIAHMTSLKTTTHLIVPSEVCIGGKDQYKDITIGRGAWVCAGAIILPGVSIGDKCLVAAGAVVISDMPPATLAAGVPAVIKKHYE